MHALSWLQNVCAHQPLNRDSQPLPLLLGMEESDHFRLSERPCCRPQISSGSTWLETKEKESRYDIEATFKKASRRYAPGILKPRESIFIADCGQPHSPTGGRGLPSNKWQACVPFGHILRGTIPLRSMLSWSGGAPLQPQAVPGGLKPEALQQRPPSRLLLGQPVSVDGCHVISRHVTAHLHSVHHLN